MTLSLVLSGIIAPALFWTAYFYYKDRKQPEPMKYLGITYLLGILAAYACMKSYGFLPSFGIPADPSLLIDHNPFQFLLYCLGVVGFMEELIKFFPFMLILRFSAFDEKIDGIIYACMIALGFASFENLYYLNNLTGFEQVGRAIASPLTHTIFSSIWGYMVGVAYLHKKSLWKATITGLALSALFHGMFDFLTLSPTLRAGSAVLILVVWIWRIRKMEKLADEHLDQQILENKSPQKV